jgi:pimeloyl-ACP methyl ester carboxylesterase
MSFSQGSFLSLSQAGFHRIAYADWGKHSAAHVVVCVHGLSRNSRDFDFLARDLARECRVVCPDVVGRGRRCGPASKHWSSPESATHRR